MQELKTKAAASAVKWLHITKWDSIKKLMGFLKKQKIILAVTTLKGRTRDPHRVDLTQPVALAIGNERTGVSPELGEQADIKLRLPMVGFIQSFNVSVAAALCLYEAFRQREAKGFYAKSQFKKHEEKKILKEWYKA